ncbi:tRNA lysidine(34) synthetase TilS [Inquilinus sp. CAU 1745]|uniref:tRNA lysidine(34) synthetase TilS n=1 Tax=Inquilinus sp. CAU 1745 TaxID=3140369 RepID=UPI00325B080C
MTLAAAFGRALDRLGPFGDRPRLAVAISGGSDSLALCLLADEWVRRRGGEVLGLTVDHGLRPDSAAEAGRVGEWLAARGIAHRILRWPPPHPAAGLQEAAREARYGLLEDACAADGILHLLLGHTTDDQAETFLLRLAGGSGVDGLAAMPAVRTGRRVRLLRPLLGLSRQDLRAELRARGQGWIDDPSNENPAFARVRLRAAGEALGAEGMTPRRLAETARRAGLARRALETAAASLAARAMTIDPEGFALIDPRPLARAARDPALRVLGRCIAIVGGSRRPSAPAALEALLDHLSEEKIARRTIGGCLLAPASGGAVLIAREPGRIPGPDTAVPGEGRWDGRFRVMLSRRQAEGAEIGALGPAPAGALGLPRRPSSVVRSWPGLWRDGKLIAVPEFAARQEDGPWGSLETFQAQFAPPAPAFGPGFAVV